MTGNVFDDPLMNDYMWDITWDNWFDPTLAIKANATYNETTEFEILR